MINIFYLNEHKGSLIINTSNLLATNYKKVDHGMIGLCDQEIVFINLFNVEKDLNLRSGSVLPSEKIFKYIFGRTNIDCSSLFDNGIMICKVIIATPIPNTHLHKCLVDIKTSTVSLICGAKNVRANLITVIATNNTILPNGKIIKQSKLHGVSSNGMLCSAKELNLDNYTNPGIIELDNCENLVGNLFKKSYINI